MILGAWLFVRGIYDLLMRISIPLLLAGLAVAVIALPPTFKWATTAGELKKSERKVEKLGGDLKVAKSDLIACQANVDTLTFSLERQNAAVDQLKADSDARTKRANAAIARAQEQARGYRAKIHRLESAKPSGDVCTSARSLIVETLRADRN